MPCAARKARRQALVLISQSCNEPSSFGFAKNNIPVLLMHRETPGHISFLFVTPGSYVNENDASIDMQVTAIRYGLRAQPIAAGISFPPLHAADKL
jgi:hypothetical protein